MNESAPFIPASRRIQREIDESIKKLEAEIDGHVAAIKVATQEMAKLKASKAILYEEPPTNLAEFQGSNEGATELAERLKGGKK